MALPTTAAGYLTFLCPALAAQAAEVRDYWLEDAAAELAPAPAGWGDLLPKATALLAAHRWTKLTRQTAGGLTATASEAVGPITSETAINPVTQKQLTRSYGAIAGVAGAPDADLARTEYGIQFLRLRQTCPAFGSRLTGLPVR
jgi:hypothetical protein